MFSTELEIEIARGASMASKCFSSKLKKIKKIRNKLKHNS